MDLSPKVVAFSKALRLIDGCNRIVHFDAARRYIALFDKMYASDKARKDMQMVAVLKIKLKERMKLL